MKSYNVICVVIDFVRFFLQFSRVQITPPLFFFFFPSSQICVTRESRRDEGDNESESVWTAGTDDVRMMHRLRRDVGG